MTIDTSTREHELGAALAELEAAAPRLAATDAGARAELARECIGSLADAAEPWAAAAVTAKGLPEASPWLAEELVTGPVAVARMLQLLVGSLEDVARGGAPRLPRPASHRLQRPTARPGPARQATPRWRRLQGLLRGGRPGGGRHGGDALRRSEAGRAWACPRPRRRQRHEHRDRGHARARADRRHGDRAQTAPALRTA